MSISEKTVFTAGLLDAEEHPAFSILDRSDEEFLEAFCELLDIQGQHRGDPIVVLPHGPVTYH